MNLNSINYFLACTLIGLITALFTGCGVQTAPGKVLKIDTGDAKPAVDEKGNEADEHQHASFYTVAHYDVDADPAEQLKKTLAQAKSENKTVLLQVGGDWCGWCKLMTQYIDDSPAISKHLEENFLIQKVTYDEKNHNEDFLSKYPKIKGYPHIFVLDFNGELLHSQNTEELEEGKGYSEKAFLEFLDKWKPDSTNNT